MLIPKVSQRKYLLLPYKYNQNDECRERQRLNQAD